MAGNRERRIDRSKEIIENQIRCEAYIGDAGAGDLIL